VVLEVDFRPESARFDVESVRSAPLQDGPDVLATALAFDPRPQVLREANSEASHPSPGWPCIGPWTGRCHAADPSASGPFLPRSR